MEVKTGDVEAGDDIDEKPPKQRDVEKVVDGEFYFVFPYSFLQWWDLVMWLVVHMLFVIALLGEAGTSKCGKRRKKHDFYAEEIFKPGGMQPPLNPYFLVDVGERKVNEMVSRSNQCDTTIYISPYTFFLYFYVFGCCDSTSWHMWSTHKIKLLETKRTSWKDGRVNYCGWWKANYRADILKIGDKLILLILNYLNFGGIN